MVILLRCNILMRSPGSWSQCGYKLSPLALLQVKPTLFVAFAHPINVGPPISDMYNAKTIQEQQISRFYQVSNYSDPHLIRWAWYLWIIKTTFPGNSFKIQQAGCCLSRILAPSSGETLTLPHYNEVILTGCPESINQSIYPLQLHWSTLAAAPSTRKH